MMSFTDYHLPFKTSSEAKDYITNDIDFMAIYKQILDDNPNCGISFEHPDLVMALTLEYMNDEDCPDLNHSQIERLKDFLHDMFCDMDADKVKYLGRIPSNNETRAELEKQ